MLGKRGRRSRSRSCSPPAKQSRSSYYGNSNGNRNTHYYRHGDRNDYRYGDYDDRGRSHHHHNGDGHRYWDSQPTGIIVRNIAMETRPQDLRIPFGRYGLVKDVYLPRDYFTGRPRGFGFVKYWNAEDAAEAKHHMDRQIILGHEVTVEFAQENRKTPQEMRERSRRRGTFTRHPLHRVARRSPRGSRRGRSRSRSRSPRGISNPRETRSITPPPESNPREGDEGKSKSVSPVHRGKPSRSPESPRDSKDVGEKIHGKERDTSCSP